MWQGSFEKVWPIRQAISDRPFSPLYPDHAKAFQPPALAKVGSARGGMPTMPEPSHAHCTSFQIQETAAFAAGSLRGTPGGRPTA